MNSSLPATKLRVPPLPRDGVRRARLVDTLDRGILDYKLILVVTPPGYGKTTLLLLGGESTPFFVAATEAVAAALPNDRLEVLPGQGHVAMDTNPALLLETVIGFLTEE